MVRIGYLHRQWIIPGGAVDRGEKIEEAALRELKEESGLELYKVISLVTRLYVTQYKRDTVHYFFAHSSIEDLSIDGQEIIDAGWFSLDNLPSDRKKRMDEVIQLYLKENT